MDKDKSKCAIAMALLLYAMLFLMVYIMAIFGMKPAFLAIVAYGLGMLTNFFIERSV